MGRQKSQYGEQNTCMYVRYVLKEFLCLFPGDQNVKVVKNNTFFQMSGILKFGFQKKRKQLHFSKEHYLNYTKKNTILHFP